MKMNLTMTEQDTLEFTVEHPYKSEPRTVKISYHEYPALHIIVLDAKGSEIDSGTLELDELDY
jgi:hypothetical protein